MSDKPYISPSQINLFDGCGEAYRRKYIEGEKMPSGSAGLRGTGVHGAAQLNHRQKIVSGTDLPLQDLVDAAATAFEAAREQGYALTPEERGIGAQIVLGRAKDRAVKLTGLYAQRVAPTIQPAFVEERVRIELPDAPVDLLGVLDVATTDRRVKDLKTAGRSKTQAEADASLQLSLYALAYRAKTGADPAGLDLEVLVDTVTPKHQRLSTQRALGDYRALIARTNALLRAREAGIFAPAAVGDWRCSEKWCPFFPTCTYVNAERRAASEAAA